MIFVNKSTKIISSPKIQSIERTVTDFVDDAEDAIVDFASNAGDVYVDFIFEDPQYGATAVKVDTLKSSLTRFNLNGIDTIKNNPIQYERTFWHKGIIPEGIPFVIRVYASVPFVASCDDGREIYRYN